MNHQATSQISIQPDRWMKLRERFLQDPLPIRLGELSSSLARANYIGNHEAHEQVAFSLLKEPALYLEWGFPDADSSLQTDLTQIRQLIVRLREDWQAVWESPVERIAIGASLGEWAQKILDRSGLLDYDDWREVFRTAPASSVTGAASKGMQ